MRRHLIPLILFTCAGTVGLLRAEDGQTATDNGIEVTASLLPHEIKGFKTFNVTLKSTRPTDHSVQVEILLNDNRVKEPGGARGKCTIMVGLKAGATMTEKKHCKETAPSNSFSVQIVKVFSKIY